MIKLTSKVNKEYRNLVEDILENPDFQSLEQYVQHYNSNRLKHCMDVSYLSWWMAKHLGLDEKAAARAGMLHDFCMYDFHEEHETYGESEAHRHPKIAAQTSAEHFHLSKKEYDAILSHMFPIGPKPKSSEAWVISLADKICAVTEFCHVHVALSRNGQVESA